jgi:hypothetical protein
MRLDNDLKPTITRLNARFRGPTESEKYFNLIQGTAHDTLLLSKVMDEDTGQGAAIRNNLAIYFSGEDLPVASNIPTTTTIATVTDPVFLSNNLSTEWNKISGVDITNPSNGVYTIATTGTTPPPMQGIIRSVAVIEGQIILIRMAIKKLSGSLDSFKFGSHNVNNGEGSMLSYIPIDTYENITYTIYCKHKEVIDLSIRIRDGSGLGEVEIKDFEVLYLDVRDFYLEALNSTIKSKVNVLEKEIQNIINNI